MLKIRAGGTNEQFEAVPVYAQRYIKYRRRGK